ncbi:MAG TPA: rod shape-determining protein MreC [Terriglobales bacterium]|nr:rod shape-determining protein MreC [Terriglobales bacterium]
MNAVTATRRTIRREWTTWGTLLILSVGLMGVSDTTQAHDLQSAVNWAVSPAETVLSNAADTAGSYWSALTQIDKLRTDSELLRQDNQTLKEQLDRMPAISKLNDDWTKITAAQQSIPYRTTPARVIVRDLSDVRLRTLLLNKGSSDGLATGQVVIDAGGAVVGRISEVDATVSTVLLLSDPSAVVVGKEAKSGATGTIRGSISGQLQMSYVATGTTPAAGATAAPGTTLAVGDSVVTAGEALPCTNDISPYPPALLIGEIIAVLSDPNTPVQGATIKPAAHLTDATFVLVIVDYQGGFGPPIPTASPAPAASAGASGSTGPAASPRASSSPRPTASPTSQC